MSQDLLHRHITVEFSVMLADDVSIEHKLDIEDGENCIAVAQRALNTATGIFKTALQSITMPVDPLPGDEPMLSLSVEYFHLHDGDLESLSFKISEIETIKPGKSGKAVDNAVSRAFKSFCRLSTKLQEVA